MGPLAWACRVVKISAPADVRVLVFVVRVGVTAVVFVDPEGQEQSDLRGVAAEPPVE